jgi:hypothetical protein
MAVPIAEGADSHRRVDPSTSVNKNVTVPDGPVIGQVSHAIARRAPTPSSQIVRVSRRDSRKALIGASIALRRFGGSLL